jgi:hypothetical protein
MTIRAYLTNTYKLGGIIRNLKCVNHFSFKGYSTRIVLGGSSSNAHHKEKSFSFRRYAVDADSVSTKSVDVNALPDSKRRLSEMSQKIDSNLGKDVIDYKALVSSLKDMETVFTKIA